jgi:hypothetical protein
MEDDLKKWKTTYKKNLFSIPLKFRGKPFLRLTKLSKICWSFNALIRNLYLYFPLLPTPRAAKLWGTMTF